MSEKSTSTKVPVLLWEEATKMMDKCITSTKITNERAAKSVADATKATRAAESSTLKAMIANAIAKDLNKGTRSNNVTHRYAVMKNRDAVKKSQKALKDVKAAAAIVTASVKTAKESAVATEQVVQLSKTQIQSNFKSSGDKTLTTKYISGPKKSHEAAQAKVKEAEKNAKEFEKSITNAQKVVAMAERNMEAAINASRKTISTKAKLVREHSDKWSLNTLKTLIIERSLQIVIQNTRTKKFKTITFTPEIRCSKDWVTKAQSETGKKEVTQKTLDTWLKEITACIKDGTKVDVKDGKPPTPRRFIDDAE
jgi:hypothetical protein